MLKLFYKGDCVEAGCDEAGRGCLAGPVVAAAVVLSPHIEAAEWYNLIGDSKKLTEKERNALRPLIMENAVAYGIAEASAKEIDEINILCASLLAMHRALKKVEEMLDKKNFDRIQNIIVDGNRFTPYHSLSTNEPVPHTTIVKGDSTYASIAAASILAKTERDRIITELGKLFPQYNWGKNKAYPTKEHRRAIELYGTTPYHRLSFKLLADPELF